MERFDTWEGELYHWGIPMMKWGQNRYQNRDGTWTAEGLARRRERERKAEAKRARKEAKASSRTKRLKDLTDDELRKRIERANLEKEYRNLTRNPGLKVASDLINSYSSYRQKKYERDREKEKNRLAEMNYRTQQIQALYGYRKAVQEKRKAQAEKIKDKKDYLIWKSNNTLRGVIKKQLLGIVGLTKVSKLEQINQEKKLELGGYDLDKKIIEIQDELGLDYVARDRARYKRFRKHTPESAHKRRDGNS